MCRNLLTLSLNIILCGYGFSLHGFIILDVVDTISYNCASFSPITSSVDASVDMTMRHTRLGLIGQDRMTTLAKGGLLSQIDKINLHLCKRSLAEMLI